VLGTPAPRPTTIFPFSPSFLLTCISAFLPSHLLRERQISFLRGPAPFGVGPPLKTPYGTLAIRGEPNRPIDRSMLAGDSDGSCQWVKELADDANIDAFVQKRQHTTTRHSYYCYRRRRLV